MYRTLEYLASKYVEKKWWPNYQIKEENRFASELTIAGANLASHFYEVCVRWRPAVLKGSRIISYHDISFHPFVKTMMRESTMEKR